MRATMRDVMQCLMSQLSAFLSVLLIASAAHKLTYFSRARTAAQELVSLSASSAAFVVAAAALCEASAALILWIPGARTLGASLAAGVFALYLSAIVHAVHKGNPDVDCGCSFGAPHRNLGSFEAVRNACLLIATGLIALFAFRPLGTSGADLLPGLALFAIYYAIDVVKGIWSKAERISK
jgi:hypothetical protein